VGSNLPGPGNHANLLIFVTGLICSAGMGMPVSGFPNQTAYVVTYRLAPKLIWLMMSTY
jgi:phosphate transporter